MQATIDPSGNKIIIKSPTGEHKREFRFKVREMLTHDQKIYVLLDTSGQDTDFITKNRNLFCLDVRGRTLWQIENKIDNEPDPYVGVYLKDGDELGVTSWAGYAYNLNANTGEVSNAKFVK